jgi:uncharacterized Fe-S radical SAM superfamily protein PflX
MAQYRPSHKAFDYPEIARQLTAREWSQSLHWAMAAGLSNLAD